MMFIHTYHLNMMNPFMIIWFMLWYRAPDRGKRMFVLISLYAKLSDIDERDTKQLSSINDQFVLAKSDQALLFPALSAKWVWRKVKPLKDVVFYSAENEEHYINRLVKKTPCWLWYGDSDQRRQDIRKLLHCIRSQQLTPTV